MANKLWLRVIHINDVYDLKYLPSLKTLINEKKQGPDETICCLAGDFLAPYLLSSLDKGRGMVDVLGAAGITHVSLGNHENDVSLGELAKRIKTSKFKWINTNMRDLDEIAKVQTFPHDTIQLQSKNDPSIRKKVALIGLLTHDPSLYRKNSFGGATIQPIMEATHSYLKQTLEPDQYDLIIPLTHQNIEEDRDFAKKFGGKVFPLVLGGHDHEPYDETHNNSRIIKVGIDAETTAVIDIIWDDDDNDADAVSSSNKSPTITVEMIPTSSYAPDSNALKRVKGHERVLDELETAKIFRIADWLPKDCNKPFSTYNNRLEPTTGSQILASMLRMGMRAQCCIINAGSFRGGKVYPTEQEWFTWSDLKVELCLPTEMWAVNIPGQVLQDAIYYSRRKSRLTPPDSTGAYMQHCDAIVWNDDKGDKIETICGKPFDPNELYFTALPYKMLQGMDDQKPLLDWVERDKIHVNVESSVMAKLVMVEMFSSLLWLEMGSFASIDTDHDGLLKYDEVHARAVEVFGEEVADLVVENVFSVADLNGKGHITPLDMMVVQFSATDMLDHVLSHEELGTMQTVASKVLDKRASHIEVKRMVQELKNALDIDKNGVINREDAMGMVGEVRRRSMLLA